MAGDEAFGEQIDLSTDDTVGLVYLDNDEKDKAKRRPLQNLLAICLVWVFTFTAYSGLQNLESSLNPGIGSYTLGAITGGGLITCLLAPTILNYIGAKYSLVASWICLCLFVAANYATNFPKYVTPILISAAGLEGLSTGLMWTAQGSYMTNIASEYSQIVGEPFEGVLSRFFGIFCMAFQSTQIWGNLISSAVLQSGTEVKAFDNMTVAAFCGADDCPADQAPGNTTEGAPPRPKAERLYILVSIYLGLTLIGLFITLVFLKPVKATTSGKQVSLKVLLSSTLHLLGTNLNMALLVPLSLYTGLEQTVMYAEFTKSFVACGLGLEFIGYTMICFGVLNTIGSPVSGILAKYIGRHTLFFFAFLINIGTLAGLRFWKIAGTEPYKSHDDIEVYLFYIFPGLWGLADAVWQTQSATLVGFAFSGQEEPAFANLRMFQAMGFTVAYFYSPHLCEYMKLYITAGWLTFSMILLAIVEVRVRRSAQPIIEKKAGLVI